MEPINYEKMIAEAKRLKLLNEIAVNEIIKKSNDYQNTVTDNPPIKHATKKN